MTIDEITTALKEWRGDNDVRSYTLIALDDEHMTVAVLGNDSLLGYALASVMRTDKRTARIVQWAMALKDVDFLSNQDNDEAGINND